ncbi:hypothetical protein ACFL42_04425 [Candidatus Omnitrophota bacterium]
MEINLYGNNPSGVKGEAFRRNMWEWKLLWYFICERCEDILGEYDMRSEGGHNGHSVSREKALLIADRLKGLLTNGAVSKFGERYKRTIEELPYIRCDFCKGSGIRSEEHISGACSVCDGLGKLRPWPAKYSFDADSIKKFAEFASQSGGFKVV